MHRTASSPDTGLSGNTVGVAEGFTQSNNQNCHYDSAVLLAFPPSSRPNLAYEDLDLKTPSFNRTLLLSAIAAISLPLQAQTRLDPLVVTVTTPLRMSQPVDQTLAATTVITRADIERQQPESVAQLLRGTPGVEFASTGGAGSMTSLFLRGSNSNHTLVLIDGVKANNPTDGSFRWEFLPVSQIERIEIVRGPQSSIWGADAIGGVINIITVTPIQAGTQGEIRVGAGQQNTQLTDANFSAANETTRFNSSLSYRKSDGFNATQTDTTGEKDGFEHYAVRLQVEQDIDDQNTVSAGYLRNQGTNEYDACSSSNACKQNFSIETIRFGWEHQLTENWAINSNLSRLSEKREDYREGLDNGKFDSYRDSLNLSAIYDSHSLSVTSGFDGNRERLRAARTGFGPTTSRTTRDSHGVFSQAFWQASSRTSVQAGFRFDHDQLFGDQSTGNIGISYNLNDDNIVGMSYSEGYKAPSLNELYGFAGNENLNAEESKNYELFWRYQPAQSSFTEIRIFQNDIDNLIDWAWTGPGDWDGQLFNLSKVRIKGAELSVGYQLNNWMFNSSLTIQNPKNRENNTLLLRRAREHAKLDIDYTVSNWGAGVTLEGQSKRYDFGNQRMGGYAIMNTRTHWHLSPDWTLRAKIDNLFDKDYEQAAGYNTQGRYFETSLTYRF